MIIWMYVAPGQGFHMILEPLLLNKRTLYIGSRMRVNGLTREICGHDVVFTSFSKLDFDPDDFDQIVVEDLAIRQREGWPHDKPRVLRQSKRFYEVVELLRGYKGPVLFRPRFGQFYEFQTLHKALAS